MADKWTALNTLWNSFGLMAYDINTVPENAVLPYITYEAKTAMLDEAVPLTASIWYRSNSWTEISQKAEEISYHMDGGIGIAYDNGRLWVTKGTPFAQRMSEPSDQQIRRIVLSVMAEFQ